MMRQNPRLFRLSASVALGALFCNTLLPAVATAQPAPPPLGAPATPSDQNQGDPPARVGRIASQTGAVSFRTDADTQWSAASPNFPVSAGNSFWTEPTARANLEISASRIALAGQTEFDLTALDTSGLQAVAAQGEVYLELHDLAPNEVWSVQTPRGMVRLTAAGRYDIAVGTTEQPTLVTVLDGTAEIDGPGVSLHVAANQTATLTGAGPFQSSVGPAERDAFLTATLNAEHPPSPSGTSVPAELAYMSGGEDLAGYGQWSQAPDYGQVWYPRVSPGWVPYREGSWDYVAPWGWTWVDSEPWGFAPFHYGRWADIGGRWGWIPGDADVSRRPVYAPALVTFIGVSAGVALGAALSRGSIGWVPLGPREEYHPWYHASQNYTREINAGHVATGAAPGNAAGANNFVNRRGATSVPASVMLRSRPVQAAARPVSAQAFAAGHAVAGQQPMRPTLATAGVTPAVAHQLNLQPERGVGPRHAAPGPVVHVQEPVAAGAVPARPALIGPRGEQPGGPHPGEVPPGAVRPPGGTPPLPTPGARPQGMSEPRTAPPGIVNRPGGEPAPAHEQGGPPPLPTPGTRPQGVPGPQHPPGEAPAARTPSELRPELGSHSPAGPEPANRPAPNEPPAERHDVPPAHVEVPHPAPSAPHVEAPRPAPAAPHVEAPRPAPAAPHVEAPRPAPAAPHVEAPRPAPAAPHVEAPRPAPAAPHVEAPRPAPPPPHAEPARPAPEKKPGER